MTRLLREMARESSRAVAEGGEGEESVFVFLPPGPRHNAYSFEEGYRDWLGRATGERGCWKEQYEVDIDAQPPPPPPVAEDGLRLWDISVKRSISRTWF